jgi:macrolide-specific efflux system membrane fusion protein
MKLKILAIVVLAAVGIGAAFIAIGGMPISAASTTHYLTSTAATGDVSDDVAATGTVATTRSYGLSFGSAAHITDSSASSSSDGGSGSTTWNVTELKVAVGQTVKAGEVLARASTSDLQRQLADANAALANAKIQQAMAQDDLDNASGTTQTRQATISLNQAKTQVSDARKTKTDLINQIRLATITAPIAGVVTAVNVTKGLAAPTGDAIVIDASTFQVTADVVESDLSKVSVGQAATVAVAAVGADLDGTVTAIAPTAAGDTSGNVVSYAVTVAIKDAPAAMRAGMTADVTITVANATNVLTVPAAALRGTTGNYSVLILGADGTPTAQPVEVGLVTNTTAEIKSGLNEGQQVVTGVANAQTGNPTVTNGGFGGGGIGIPGGGFGGGNGRNRVVVGN